MWEKFKESKFAKKCKELSGRRGVVAVTLCLILTLTVIISVSVANNRAKKKYGDESDTGAGNGIHDEQTTAETPSEDVMQGTVDAPVHNEESESLPVNAEPEPFQLARPAEGVLTKGHDATIQVWSETMSDYRVHLGIDIMTEAGAPVLAAADGVVEKIWDDALMGRCVAVSHDGGIYTFYKNLDPVLTEGIIEGAEIKCGGQLGRVGESAIAELADEPHLHLEMTVNGLAVDPSDYFSREVLESMKRDQAFEAGAETENAVAEK